MLEQVSAIANIVTIAGFILSFGRKKWKIIGVLTIVVAGSTAIVLHSRPIVSIHTSFIKFESGYYSAIQQKIYAFPLSFWTHNIRNENKARDDDGSGPRPIFLNYTIGSMVKHSSETETTNIDFIISKISESQILSHTYLDKLIEADPDKSSPTTPPGWAAMQINTANFYPAKELMITLDFQNLANEGRAISAPKFYFTEDLNALENQSKDPQQLLQNAFVEMKVVQHTNNTVWFTTIKNPPKGRVLVRWPVY